MLRNKKTGLEMKSLSDYERRILLQSLVVRALELFESLEKETFDLDIFNYFSKHYETLYRLINAMENDYPSFDMSTNNIDVLYRRKHFRDKLISN